jgi:uncharacterized membrane protein YgdD (TMEM256/DUF423 family)
MQRIWLAFGAAFGLLTVAMAAIQAHTLSGAGDHAREVVGNAVLMQGLHALVLLFLALYAERGGVLARLAGVVITFGVIAFCGTIYASVFPPLAPLHYGPLAPIGGTSLMLGWLLLLLSALRR